MGGMQKQALLAMIVLSALIAFATIFTFMPLNFNPDSAFYLLLAKEQLRSGSLFPPGMCYSTELFVLTPAILMVPFMAILDNWMVIRSAGICLAWAIMLFCLIRSFVSKGDEHWTAAAISIVLLCIPPYGSEVVDKLFLQGAYLSYCISLTIYLLIGHYLCLNRDSLESDLVSRANSKRMALLFGGLILAIVLPNLGGIRGIIQGALPFGIALVLLCLVNGKTLDDVVSRRLSWVLAATWAIGIVLAFVGYKALSARYWQTSDQMVLTMGNAQEFVDGMLSYIANFLSLYGQSFKPALMSLGGIVKALNYAYACLSIIVLPVWGLVNIKRLSNRYSQFVVLFAWASDILLFFISVASGSMGLASRYLIPSYFINIPMAAVCLEELLSHRTRLEGRTVLACILTYAIISTGFFWRRSLHEKYEDHTHQDIVQFLEDHDLDFGYATFFNSYVNTCFANGDVEFLSFGYDIKDSGGDPRYMWRWLTNERWYDPEYHPGRCFILLRGEERVDEQWYELAEEVLAFEDYTILVFEKNINLY